MKGWVTWLFIFLFFFQWIIAYQTSQYVCHVPFSPIKPKIAKRHKQILTLPAYPVLSKYFKTISNSIIKVVSIDFLFHEITLNDNTLFYLIKTVINILIIFIGMPESLSWVFQFRPNFIPSSESTEFIQIYQNIGTIIQPYNQLESVKPFYFCLYVC